MSTLFLLPQFDLFKFFNEINKEGTPLSSFYKGDLTDYQNQTQIL